jgi:DNA-binding NtrC family response regulator
MNMQAVASKENSILFVDDERRVLTSMRAMFRRDYNVLLANSGEEALDILRSQTVDVVVSDQRMPGMTGVDVLKAVKTMAPRTMRILLTGYADLQAIEASINEAEVFRYLMKPCPSAELKDAVALAANVANGVFDEADAGKRSESVAAESTDDELGLWVSSEILDCAPAGDSKHTAGLPESARTPVEPADVEILVLSRDPVLTESLDRALGERRTLYHVSSIPQAIEILEKCPIGVLVTDTAINEREVASLTAELKAHVPELVTVIASERSDAQALITMINYGQIFRFLLKPLQVGQCRLWIESAINKHVELTRKPQLVERHQVSRADENAGAWLIGVISDRIRRLRGRLIQSNRMA